MKTTLSMLALAIGTMTSASALANISVNVGAIQVAPNDSSSSLNVVEQVAGLPAGSTAVGVNNNTQLGLTIDYKIDNNWTMELIAATPFSHDITVKGSAIDGLDIGNTKHLPPTLLAQYHFDLGDSKFDPFVGLGLNFTKFFDSSASGALKSTLQALNVATANDNVDLKLKDSWGLAVQAGVNYQLDQHWGFHFMVSKMDIDTVGEVRLNGTTIQSVDVQIDPLVMMVGVRWSM
ncbi:MAG: outer membrane beta-barrel protein [Gammaproteobacteria bacterium]|nr:outer membrane beta-barrel protein [Gammaproteobacteria bacterium]